MAKSLLETFSGLDANLKHALDEIPSPRLLALAALQIAETEAGVDLLSVEHIVASLEAAGVAVKKLSVARSLAAATGFVSSRRQDGEIFYKIMTKGKKQVSGLLTNSKLSVVRIEKDQPRTARLELKDMFAELKGVVRICDPYYGIRTFDALDYVPVSCEIRFMSVNPTDSATKLAGLLKDFKKERPKTEFRIATKSAGIHDRYIVTKECIIILGHGLKDIGGKESFVINLNQSLVPDLVTSTMKSFDDKWKLATIL